MRLSRSSERRTGGEGSSSMAFATDPIMRWGWPDRIGTSLQWPPIADAFAGRAFDHGTAHGLEGCLAVALWMHRVEPDAETVVGLMGESTATRPPRTP